MAKRSKKWGDVLILGCLLLFLDGVLAHAQTEKWVYYTDGPARAYSVVYGGNNVYAAGYIEDANGDDFAVVSIDTTGQENWVVTYNGSSNGDDQANSVIYGSDGNIYAAGKINNTGTANDFAVVSLNSSGGENWIYSVDGGVSEGDVANVVVYGDDGYVYAAGNGNLSTGNKDFVIIGITPSVTQNWIYTHDGSATDADAALDMILGADGNLYASGYCTETSNNKDFAVISVDTAGNERWVYTFDGAAANAADRANSVIYGLDGYIYAAGKSKNTGEDITVAKINRNTGIAEWVYTADTTGTDGAYEIVYGSDNNLYIAGYIKGTQQDYAVVCIDTAGTKQWQYKKNGSSTFQIPVDYAYSICAGTDGNVYATGYLQNEGTGKDLFLTNLDATGSLVWNYTKNMSGGGGSDIGEAIHWGSDDKLYIAGLLSGANGRFGVICIDPAPVPTIWTYPNFIMVLLQSGEIDYRELKISNVGLAGTTLDWTLTEVLGNTWLDEDSTQGSLGDGDTVIVTITFDATGLGAGAYYDTLEIASNDPITPLKRIPVKLTVQVGIEEFSEDQPLDDRCELISSFFNKIISLRFTKPSDTSCEITLYNAVGARVYKTILSSTPGLIHLDNKHIAQLARGVYFITVSRYPVMKALKF